MKNKFLVFLTIGVVLFIFFYFSDYYFNLNIGDTYYVINYFYPILILLIIGGFFIFIKKPKEKYHNYLPRKTSKVLSRFFVVKRNVFK